MRITEDGAEHPLDTEKSTPMLRFPGAGSEPWVFATMILMSFLAQAVVSTWMIFVSARDSTTDLISAPWNPAKGRKQKMKA